jgi:hypothetical protein
VYHFVALGFVAGVLTGNPHKTLAGDVVVVTKAVEIDTGITSESGFQPGPEVFKLPDSMRAYADTIQLDVSRRFCSWFRTSVALHISVSISPLRTASFFPLPQLTFSDT